ncbi:MAG: hypothetical protein HOC45_10535, partial [Marinovum sp.]|nr:hypothetical protein [Marinovum sp.]
WVITYAKWLANALRVLGASRQANIAQDWALRRKAKRIKQPEIIWSDWLESDGKDAPLGVSATPLRAAE